MPKPTRQAVAAGDVHDPLAPLRSRFVIADEHPLYLDGNSLGQAAVGDAQRRPLLAALTALRHARPPGRHA
jgi:kynureninase